MDFSNIFSYGVGAVGIATGIICALNSHRSNKREVQRAKEAKNDEWSISRVDIDEWILERRAPGKIKVYGYTMDKFTPGEYDSILAKFNEPQVFVMGEKMILGRDLKGEDWDLTLYYNDFAHAEKNGSGPFPQDADKWVGPLA